jgi:hypothetical protein
LTEQEFIARFPRARQTGRGKYVSPCSAHEDRLPSLSIGFAPDGRILIHCHAGCSPLAVLEAVGLALSDLFPHHGIRDYMPSGVSQKARYALAHEEQIVAIARADLKAGKRLSEVEKARLELAIQRLRANAEPSDPGRAAPV